MSRWLHCGLCCSGLHFCCFMSGFYLFFCGCRYSMVTLKMKHSLKGKSLVPLFKALRSSQEAQDVWAKLKATHELEAYKPEELKVEIEKLTGTSADDILQILGLEDVKEQLMLVLHHSILIANEFGQPAGSQTLQSPPASTGTSSREDESGSSPSPAKQSKVDEKV